MSHFLIYFIFNILINLFKISSQNQNNISFKETKLDIISIHNFAKDDNPKIKENPEIIRNLTKTKNDTKYIDNIIQMIKINDTMLDYILLATNNTTGYSVIFKSIRNILRSLNDSIELFLNSIYKNRESLIKINILDNKSLEYMLYFLNDEGFLELIKNVSSILIQNKTLSNNLFGILEDQQLIAKLENNPFKDKISKIIEVLVVYCVGNRTIMETLKSIGREYIKREMEKLPYISIITKLMRLIFLYFTKSIEDDLHKNLSYGCLSFLNYTFFTHLNNELKSKLKDSIYDKNISNYYWYKIIVDSTTDKNDFLTMYNCFHKKPYFNVGNNSLNILENQPAFIISIVDLLKRYEIKKVNTYFEDYYFTYGLCFPQGIESENKKVGKKINENDTNEYYICEKSDYEFISKLLLTFLFKFNITDKDIKVKIVEIRKNPQKKSIFKYLVELIPFFIFLIPILIDLFLFFYKECASRMKKKTLMYNKIIRDDENDNDKEEDNDKEDDNDKENNEQKRKNTKFVKLVPRWYKILNEFFSLKNNAKELFCFSSDATNINNNTGLVYIKGLIGISMILMIIGHIYLVLFNLPAKEFGKYQFSYLISNPLYIFPFIGLRYSPRILFSCSGFTLSFKFLSYISQNSGCKRILKFVLAQSYKYLILINLILFARCSMQHIITFFLGDNPMWKIFYEIELSEPNEAHSFIYKLLSNRIFFFNEKVLDNHDFLDYYWVAYNEVFFFLIGISLLSIGYKYKLKIDYFILILILLIYAGKIVLYHNKFLFSEKEFFATLYYYLYDYGIIMMNPLFNLPCFLIGMYFGIINYSIHKGIINIDINMKIFKKIHMDNSISEDNNMVENLSLLPHRTTFDKNQSRDECPLNILEEEDDEDNNTKNRESILSNKITKVQKLEEINLNNRNSINLDNSISEDGDLRESKNKSDNLSSNSAKEKKIKNMPFLNSSIKIIEWHQKPNINYLFIIIVIIISLILLFLMFVNWIFFIFYEKKFPNEKDKDQLLDKFSLEKFNNNDILNNIFLLDIEVFVFLVQWLLFILFMKRQYFFIDFFSNILWSTFNKSQFSFLIVYSFIILHNFYASETVVKINLYNLFLYYGINLVFISIYTIIVYIIIELPMKKIFKYFLKEEYKIEGITEEIEEEEEEDDDENEDEDENYNIVSKDDEDEDN